MKKKLIKGSLALVTVLLIIGVSCFGYYYFTSMSAKECLEYCEKNSQRNSDTFGCIGDERYNDYYMYWIAKNKNSSQPQEIFIFKEFTFGPFDLGRYRFVTSNCHDIYTSNNKVGAIEFVPTNDRGEEEDRSTLIFYGSLADSDIAEYEYTLSLMEGENTYSGTIRNHMGIFFIKFNNISASSDRDKFDITKAEFSDSKGNIVCTYKK